MHRGHQQGAVSSAGIQRVKGVPLNDTPFTASTIGSHICCYNLKIFQSACNAFVTFRG